MTVRYNIFGYLIGEGFRNVFKNKKSSIASLVIMCATMFVFGIFFMVGENVNHLTKTIEEQQGMSVFIKDSATDAQKTELETKIRNMEYVNTVTAKTKEDALEEVKRLFKDKKNLITTYERDNPFKASFVVTLTDLEKAGDVKTQIESSSEIIANVVVRSDTMETLVKIADGIKIISIVILVILNIIAWKSEATLGSHNWIDLKFMKLQPSEPSKVVIIAFLAILFEKYYRKLRTTNIPHYNIIGKLLIIALIIPAIVFLQKDLGTLLITLFIIGMMFLASPILKIEKLKYGFLLLIISLAGFFFFINNSADVFN